jgi:hypothetical protein
VGSRILPIRAVSNEEIGSASSLRRLRKAFVHRAAKAGFRPTIDSCTYYTKRQNVLRDERTAVRYSSLRSACTRQIPFYRTLLVQPPPKVLRIAQLPPPRVRIANTTPPIK